MPDLQSPIAVGRTAEIYPWGEGKILKLYLSSIPLFWFEGERNIAQYLNETDLPVPRLYERIQCDGRPGLVYEQIHGPAMLDELGRKPWGMVSSARLLARLHAQVHAIPAPPQFQTQRDWIRGGILGTPWLPEALRQDVVRLLDSLPDGDRLCHGDFHPGNILVTARGPVIIDWMTASRGTAAGDVARTSVILEAASPPPGTPMRWLIEAVRRQFRSTYLKTYFDLRPADRHLFVSWQTVMAANFLDVSQPEEREKLILRVRQGLAASAAE